MTEKQYGGQSSHGVKEKNNSKSSRANAPISNKKEKEAIEEEGEDINIEKLKKAGDIVKKTKIFAREIVKKNVPLLEIAEKIENKIIELGGKPAFPVNLSINEIAAHATPSYDDKTLASGLIKVDIGVHIDGYVADTAFSLDLENSQENKNLIDAAETALKEAVAIFSVGVELNQIGGTIEKTIAKFGARAVANLSGHSLAYYNLHAGITIPNFGNYSNFKIPEGVYAIEPFATSGVGKVKDGKPSGIFMLEKEGSVRDAFAREVLEFIVEEYNTLPFCSRWLVKKFGTRALIALRRIEESGILHSYSQLVEQTKKPVAQAEHTIILTNKEKIITT